MHIIKFEAQNYKILKAVSITPTGYAVIISGANDQGKSSVLDAIMTGITGSRGAMQIKEPVRHGEESATVAVDLGALKITRTWGKDGGSKVIVTNANGARFSSPQAVLDSLVGNLAFDPLEFARMQPKAQRDILLRLVDLPFDVDENDAQRVLLLKAKISADALLTQAEQDVARLPMIPDDTPDEEAPVEELLMSRLRENYEIRSANDAKRDALREALRVLGEWDNNFTMAGERIKELEKELEDARFSFELCAGEWRQAKSTVEHFQNIVDSISDPDDEDVYTELEEVKRINANVRQLRHNATALAARDAHWIAADAAKLNIKEHDEKRAAALKAASFPVDGLGFSETGITYNGLPFAQASESQRIKISAAIGMSNNPELRVMFIREGSLLDAKRLDEITELAKEYDYQLWLEVVDDTGEVGVVIEDGEVKRNG